MKMQTAFLAAALAVLPTCVSAQQDSAKTTIGPPIQKVATATAVSTEPLGAITSVAELPDGRVLVNDGQRRRLLLMDTTMKISQVVLDSLTDVANAYGTRAGALLPFRGDTTLFVDPASYAILMLDGSGRIARIRAVWRSEDVGLVTATNAFGMPGVDALGRIVYRMPAVAAPPLVAPPAGVPYFPMQPDSAFIVAVNLNTRKLDTLGVMRTPKSETRIRQMAGGGFSFDQIINPLPRTDEWAVTSDGRLAIVRGQDYRIEYLQPDGTWKSSEKLPYDWQRMLDDDKQRMVDSIRNVQSRNVETQYVNQVIRWVNMYNGKYPEGLKVPEGYVPQPGFAKDWQLPAGVKFPENYLYACAPGQEPPPGMQVMGGLPGGAMPGGMTITSGSGTNITMGGGARVTMGMDGPPPGAAPAGAAPGGNMTVRPGSTLPPGACLPAPVSFNMGGMVPPPPTMRPVLVVPPSDLPDYKPPFTTGAVRSDADGNLWIRTVQTKPVPGGGVYDIVSPQGELITRYQLPVGYTIVGFGKGKIVYASMRDPAGIHLARIRLK